MIRKLFNWIFKAELDKLASEILRAKNIADKMEAQYRVFNKVLAGIDVSVDVHEHDHRYSPSWAVISLQGQRADYIKFVELGQSDINEISRFLRNFERAAINIKVDASPHASQFLRIPRSKYF